VPITHDLTNKNLYPQNHRFVTNQNKMNLFSSIPIHVGDTVMLNRKSLKIAKIDRQEEASNCLVDNNSLIKRQHTFYFLTVMAI